MHTSKITSALALFFATLALLVSIYSVYQPKSAQITDEQLDHLVDAALVRKERIYVMQLAPEIDRVYKDMIRDYKSPEKQPETFAELFTPAIRIINGMATQ